MGGSGKEMRRKRRKGGDGGDGGGGGGSRKDILPQRPTKILRNSWKESGFSLAGGPKPSASGLLRVRNVCM